MPVWSRPKKLTMASPLIGKEWPAAAVNGDGRIDVVTDTAVLLNTCK
jgi:hypothetical protein